MIWLIVIAVLVIAIGPALYLLPSKRDKRLTALRSAARAEGLAVELKQLRKLDAELHERATAGGEARVPKRLTSGYGLALGQGLTISEQGLLKDTDGTWVASPDVGTGKVEPRFVELWSDTAQALPADTVGATLTPQFVWMYWLEKAPAEAEDVARIATVLKELRDKLVQEWGQA